MLILVLTVALSLGVTSDGESVFVSNDGPEPLAYSIQIGDGYAEHEVAPGEVKRWWGDMPHWAVWDEDGTLIAYGVLDGADEPPAPVEEVTEKLTERGESVAPDVRVFDGPYLVV